MGNEPERKEIRNIEGKSYILGLIDFTWCFMRHVEWKIMFEELIKFKDREGHCNLPKILSDNPEY